MAALFDWRKRYGKENKIYTVHRGYTENEY
jgi:hypothetical protein